MSGSPGCPTSGDGGPRRRDRAERDRATVLAVFSVVLHLALVVCAFGFVSLLADVDVVSRAGTGALVGPAMITAGVLAAGVLLVRDARSAVTGERRRSWPLLVGLVALLTYVSSGAVLVLLEEGSWFEGLLFASSTLTSVFPYVVGVLAAVVAVAYAAIADARPGAGPRWPWERDGPA
ncbi:hypothetical protein ELQ92_06020 [Labedella populi]|uniref:Uncharacterized protein n=1 Tax=Labedella populi TaxID=2498850 RepID=A0A3S4C879_9MICO|nr:DUF6121 family protein [Labedella populi]RWZ64322.1 hypothetical protein ELQ92_06020 [Labedella populi]